MQILENSTSKVRTIQFIQNILKTFCQVCIKTKQFYYSKKLFLLPLIKKCWLKKLLKPIFNCIFQKCENKCYSSNCFKI